MEHKDDSVDVRDHAPAEPGAEAEIVSTFSPARRAFEMIYLVFAVVDALLIIRVVLKVLGANMSAGFTQFVYGVTGPLLAPFHALLPNIVNGKSVFETSTVVAILVYALFGYLLARLVAAMFRRDVTIAQGGRKRSYRPGPE
jgi:uncharacterized protein YggT (Ycf19 family)